MNKKLMKIAPLAIFGGLLLVAVVIKLNPPAAPQRPAFSGPMMVVDTAPVMPRDYQIKLESYGTIQPQVETTLIAQVGGQIVSVNPNVRNGGFFNTGDVLASIDARDYEADVQIAEAILMDARQALAEAEARSNQAKEDWERLGNEGEAPALVLKVPQLQAARARIASAESTLQKAELRLERTRIVAPFDGRILKKYADIGQVVSSNSPLADIYATDYVEIRLPIRNRDLGFIDLPETYRFEDGAKEVAGVKILSQFADGGTWDARLVRTEGAIDATARQLHVIAQIDNPFDRESDNKTPLKIGQYVAATLDGKTVADAIVIPNNAIYQGAYVYVVEDGILQRREIEIEWQNDSDALVSEGLSPGDALVTTSLGQVSSGIRVSVTGEMGNNQNVRGGAPGAARPGAKPNGDAQ